MIGHTNTGKTSILRTLLRDPGLGEVKDEPGTTRRRAVYPMSVGGRVLAELSDTPGLEEAPAVLDALRGLEAGLGLTPASAMEALLAQPPPGLTQELEPLRALIAADAGLLVFDAREAPRAKHWEEHELLRRCGRPIVAVLNGVAPGAAAAGPGLGGAQVWDAELRRNGLHAVVRYDAWAADEADAARLLVKLRELLGERHAAEIDRIIERRREAERLRVLAMAEVIAAMAVDLAALTIRVPAADRGGDRSGGGAMAESRLAGAMARAWSAARASLAGVQGVSAQRVAAVEAELERGLAAPGGPRAGEVALAGGATAAAAVVGGLLAGAAKGAIADALAGGATMGLGVVLGGAAGLALGGRRLARAAVLRARGEVELGLSDGAIAGAIDRAAWLAGRLRVYGHASERPILGPERGMGAGSASGHSLGARLVRGRLRSVRLRPGWSGLEHPAPAGTGWSRPEGAGRVVRELAGLIAGTLGPC